MKDMQLNIKFPLRPCLVDGEKMLFHAWGTNQKGGTVGIVEDFSGTIKTAFPHRIQFNDEIFKEYMFKEW